MQSTTIDPTFFAFENDFVDSLRCIPMIVRYKLDTVGIKLKLPEWVRLSVAEKQELAQRSCTTVEEIARYRTYLQELVLARCQHTATELGTVEATWENLGEIPAEVQAKALEYQCPTLSLTNWMNLTLLQRFALVKLSRSGHEGENFPRAIREFGL